MLRKNTASQFIHFQGVDATTGGIKSGVTWTMRRCIDGTFAAGGATITEDGTAGWYKAALTQADTNGNNIAYNFTGTGAVPQTVNIVTTACDPTSTAFGLSLAKTTNITGFNDISVSNIWQDTTAGDFTVALSIGKSIMNGVSLGTGLTVNDLTTKTGFSLTQSFPTNFSSLSIDASGRVTLNPTQPSTTFAALTVTGQLLISDGMQIDVATAGRVGLKVTGAAASGATAAGAGVTLTGGAASTTGGGTAALGFIVTGGAGAASTNGAAGGVLMIGGGTNTVNSIASGLTMTGTSNGHGMFASGHGTGYGINTSSSNSTSINGNLSGTVGGARDNSQRVISASGLSFTSTTIEWGAAYFGVDNAYRGCKVNITSGSSVLQQSRTITGYTDSTGSMTIDRAWDQTPDSSNTVEIFLDNQPKLDSNLKIQGVVLTDTLTTYTGNTPQTGDSFARIGVAGVGLTNLGDTRIAHLDADVSSRMATFTYTTPPTTASIATAIFTDLLSGSDFSTAGSFGKLIKDDIDAAISSRSTYAGADTSGTTTLLSRIGSSITISGGKVAATVASGDDTDAASIKTTIGVAGVGLTNLGDTRIAHLNADVSSRATTAAVASQITTDHGSGSYQTATGFSTFNPTSDVVAHVTLVDTTTNLTNAGTFSLDLDQAIPTTGNTPNTVGDALNAARAQGFGKWVVDGIAKTLTLYAPDGITPVRVFNLDSITEPLSRS